MNLKWDIYFLLFALSFPLFSTGASAIIIVKLDLIVLVTMSFKKIETVNIRLCLVLLFKFNTFAALFFFLKSVLQLTPKFLKAN